MFTRLFNRSRRNRTVRRSTPHPVLRLSPLDDRIVPAAAVTAVKAGSLLTITGADTNTMADDQQVFLSGTNGNLMIQGLNGTLVNGQPIVFFKDLSAITCDMNKGNDYVGAFGLTLPGALTIKGGAGNNTTHVGGNSTLGGLVVSGGDDGDILVIGGDNTANTVKGATRLDFGAGTNFTSLGVGNQADVQLGSLTYTGKAGSDQISATGLNLYVDGATTLNLGEGANGVGLWSKSIGSAGAFRLSSGAGDDNFHFGAGVNQSEFTVRSLNISAGAGNNTVKFESSTVGIEEAFSYTGGAGSDSVHGGTLGMLIGLSVNGAVTFNGGEGNNILNLMPTGSVHMGSLSMKGGGAYDKCEIHGADLVINGNVTVNDGDGFNQIMLRATDVLVKGAVTFTGGSDGDYVELGATGAATSFKTKGLLINLGAGQNNFYMDAEKTTISGALTATAGAGNDIFWIGHSGFMKEFQTTGALSVNLGPGGSDFRLIPQHFNVGAASTIAMGTGHDEVTIGRSGGQVDLKGLALNLGDGGNSAEFPAMVTNINGPLAINAGWGADTISFTGVSIETKGAANIGLGSGDNALTFTNLITTFGGALTVNTGDGADTLNLNGNTLTAKSATFNLGNDDNSLMLACSLGTIAGRLGVTGGNGDDGVQIGATSHLDVSGPISIDVTGGKNKVELDGLAAKGQLSVRGGDDGTQLRLTDIHCDGAFTTSLGAGFDFVAIDDCVFNKAVTMATGGYSDVINIEQSKNNNVPTIFNAATTFNLGTGSDDVWLDTGNNDAISFLGAIKVDGGTGVDEIIKGSKVTFSQTVAKLNLEFGP